MIEYYTEIEKGNKMLLEKLTNIIEGKPGSTSGYSNTGHSYKRKSLNRSYRKREISKIMDDNKALLKRLQTKRSNYNVNKWDKEYKKRTKLLNNICEYPYQFKGKSTRGKSSDVTRATQYKWKKLSRCSICL